MAAVDSRPHTQGTRQACHGPGYHQGLSAFASIGAIRCGTQACMRVCMCMCMCPCAHVHVHVHVHACRLASLCPRTVTSDFFALSVLVAFVNFLGQRLSSGSAVSPRQMRDLLSMDASAAGLENDAWWDAKCGICAVLLIMTVLPAHRSRKRKLGNALQSQPSARIPSLAGTHAEWQLASESKPDPGTALSRTRMHASTHPGAH